MRIILFDGFCNLCGSTVRFILRRPSGTQFRFIPLQSEEGKRLLEQHRITIKENSSVIYLKENRHFLRSGAILHILKDLRGGWQVIYYTLILIPSFIRDPIYNLISRLRYRIRGKRETCFLPPPPSHLKE